LHLVDGIYEFQLAGGSHSSGNLINLAQTTGLAVLFVDDKFIPAGEIVKVLVINH
jgi:molybdopterin molybdotransferase